MVRTILYLLCLAVALCYALSANAQSEKRIAILYDAFGPPSSLKMDWGFAALMYNARRILFDTGNNARIFEHKVNQLNVDLTRLDAVVISHRHGDHTSGLNYLLKTSTTLADFLLLTSVMGFPNQFFNDSWVVGIWRAGHGGNKVGLGRRAWALARAVPGALGSQVTAANVSTLRGGADRTG
jgi:hypothetical protein